jgi:hypothetical protein
MSNILMRGTDGSLIVERQAEPVDGVRLRALWAAYYMADGRMIVYTPEPLRLSGPDREHSIR